MTTIRKELPIDRPAAEVWDAVRATGSPHVRLARGFVVDTVEEPGARVVTFANGAVARELLLDVDDGRRRLAYAVVDSPLGMTHHHATMEVVERTGGHGGDRCTLRWVVDVAPPEAAEVLGQMMDFGELAMFETLCSPRPADARRA